MGVKSSVKAKRDRIENAVPQRTAPVDFVVIGAMRAGTTTLHELLSRHPGISMSRDKETDYFVAEKNWWRGPDWYEAQFDPSRALRGEVSPNYSKARDFPGVPARLAEHCPDARLIYIVRDPVARALSQYAHSWAMGELDQSPEELMRSDEYLSLLDISSYSVQLEAWLRHFPAERILIVDFRQLVESPRPQIDRLLAHIGAPSMALDEVGTHNGAVQLSRVPRPLMRLARGRMRPLLTRILGQRARSRLGRLVAVAPPRPAPPVPEALQQRMREDLRPDAERFRRMTGMEFPHWSV